MENKKEKPTDKETSTEATVERGKAAIKADEKVNNANPEDPKTKDEKKKDAEQWRNEG